MHMWLPDVVGREVWDRVLSFPRVLARHSSPQVWGKKLSPRCVYRLDNFGPSLKSEMVVVVVECYCFLIIIIVEPPESRPDSFLYNCRHFQVSNVTTHTQNHQAAGSALCCCDLVASSQSATVLSIWLPFCILNSIIHMFCSISLFSLFFFVLIFLQNHCK